MSMYTLSELPIGTTVKFTTEADVGGSSAFEGTIVAHSRAGYVNSSLAQATHANVWPNITTPVKEQIENDWASYDYIVIQPIIRATPPQNPDNATPDTDPVYRVDPASTTPREIGLAWIRPGTVQVVASKKLTIVISNFNESDLQNVKDTLATYRDVKYTVENM